MTRSQALELFNTEYGALKEGDRTNFTRIFNKLLQVNYLTKRKPTDNNDYHTILALSELFTAFFKLAGFTLEIRKQHDCIFIINDEGQNHLNLRKITTIILLAFRLLYQEKLGFVSLTDDIEVYFSELHEKLTEVGFVDNKRVTKKDLKPEVEFLKRYNIIHFTDQEIRDTSIIKIYPTILYVCDFNEIKDIIDSIDGLVKPEEKTENEETD